MNKKEIWCTLGPASLNDHVIGRLEELGVSLLRINLSHTIVSNLPKIVEYIQSRTDLPICLDTEGAQVRSYNGTNLKLQENTSLRVTHLPDPNDKTSLTLYPVGIAQQLVPGDLMKIDADVLAQVVSVDLKGAVLWILNGGTIGSSKAITVLERDVDMPPLTEKDEQAMEIGKQYGIKHVALSFANCAADVDVVRAAALPGATITSKIECLNGLFNLSEIASRSDAILIDRGDLSRQVNVAKLPLVQKDIIRRSKALGVPVYVATNLMESMVTSPAPTRAEVNDVFNTLEDGADGLVLAAETAVGAFPVAAASMVRSIIGEFENSRRFQGADYSPAPISMLIEPHGGCLINREALRANRQELLNLKKLTVKDTDLMDCAQIANGTYSPLRGFMDQEELQSVLRTNRLKSGLPWTMPIVLQVSEQAVADIAQGDRIALTNSKGQIHASLEVSEIYSFDLEEVAQLWFGTTSREHPGVAKLAAGGNRFVAGNIMLVAPLSSAYQRYQLAPTQSRLIFAHKGWSKVVGFHTRNVPHRVHEFIQMQALESVHADGLFISPVIGPKKAGDFLAEPILESYQLLVDSEAYPRGKVVLGAFTTYSRYCGPREAVFTAICRKNLGCSHFIVGRDHTGVAGFYQEGQVQALFEELGDIGIKPIFFESYGFNPETNQYDVLSTPNTMSISGTQFRNALLENDPLPDWFVRDDVQKLLRDRIATKRPVFCESDIDAAIAN
jgi:pyruvate kinase